MHSKAQQYSEQWIFHQDTGKCSWRSKTKQSPHYRQRTLPVSSDAHGFGKCTSHLHQHLMQLVLQGLSWKTCLVYLDDIIVYGPSLSVHLQHLREVLERLRAANLKLKTSKCCFGQQEVTFLGHVVSAAGLKPDPKNIGKVRLACHKKPTEVRAFLRLCSYYQCFI